VPQTGAFGQGGRLGKKQIDTANWPKPFHVAFVIIGSACEHDELCLAFVLAL
jgi:hypothetical protein